MSKIVVICLLVVFPARVRMLPKVLMVLSVAEVSPTNFALTSHHVQPSREATCTAPHEYFSQIATPSTFWANWAVKILLFDAVPTSSLAVGIFAYTSPLALNPLGGHLGFGDGETVTFLRGFFLTTAFFVAVGLDVAFAETEGLAEALAVGTGVAFVVAAWVGTIANASINVITMPKMRLIAIPLKFANREKDSNHKPENKDLKRSACLPRFSYFLGSK